LEQVPEKLVVAQIVLTANQEHTSTRELARTEQHKAEVDTAALFWRIPWEHERHLRILRNVFTKDKTPFPAGYKKWNAAAFIELRQPDTVRPLERDIALTQLHAAELKIALRLYQARNHDKLPAEKLGDLLPRYLPAIPVDPFDGQPFRYRISKGEWLRWYNEQNVPQLRRQPAAGGGLPPIARRQAPPFPEPPLKYVPPGHAILWSVGRDQHDNGGKNHYGLDEQPVNQDPDMIYLTPPPPYWRCFPIKPLY
jgi:hypothetical protein